MIRYNGEDQKIPDRMMVLSVSRWRLVCLALIFLAVFNQWLFAGRATIPLVQSDAWTSLTGWLGRALDGDLRVLDLLVQPTRDTTNLFFQKLLVIGHARFLALDFSVEGPIAAISALAIAVMLIARLVGFDIARWHFRDWTASTAIVLFASTLASTNVYTWGLAGLWFTWLALSIGAFLWISRPVARPWQALVAGIVVGLAVDEMAVVVVLPAAVLALFMAEPARFRTHLPILVAFAIGVLATQAIYAFANTLAGLPDVDDVPGGWSIVLSPRFALAFLTQPLLEVLAPAGHRDRLFGAAAPALTAIISLLSVGFHFAFWAHVVRRIRSGGLSPALTLSVFLMLVSFAMVVGIGHQRVAAFGLDYLQQPRYLVFYVLQPIAFVAALHDGWPAAGRAGRLAAVTTLFVLAFLQAAHAAHAWAHLKYLSLYVQQAAHVFGEMDADPSRVPANCPDIFVVCAMDESSRQIVMQRLRNARVNLYDPDFRARHRLSMASDEHGTVAVRP